MVIVRLLFAFWLGVMWHNTATAKTFDSSFSSGQATPRAGINGQNGSNTLIYAAEGGDVSGGGSTILFESRRYLLDVFFDNLPQQLQAQSRPLQWGTNKIDRFEISASDVSNQLEAAFAKINRVSPSLAEVLRAIAEKTPVYLVSGRFQVKDANYVLNPYLKYPAGAELSTSALNIRGIGILISKNDFAQMNAFNQAALIMHELIRYMQIHFSVNLKNSDIQNLTRAAMVPALKFEDVLAGTVLSFMSDVALSEKLPSRLAWESLLAVHQQMAESQSELIMKCQNGDAGSGSECKKIFEQLGKLIR